jgi:ferredoxin-type protein NapH
VSTPVSQIVRTFHQDPQPYKESPLLRNNIIRDFLIEHSIDFKHVWSLIYDEISGGAYSVKFFSLKIAEPMTSFFLVLRNSINIEFWNWTAVVSIFIPLLFVFLFGRIYCSFICPWSMISNFSIWINEKFFKRYPDLSSSISEKYIPIWKKYYTLILGTLILFNPIIIQYILPPAIIQNGWSDFILFGNVALWLIIFFILLIFEIIKPTFFCKMLCPTGIFLSIAGKFRVFQLGYIKKNKCDKDCVLCNEKCWLGIDPKINAKDSACDLCARCIKVCPTSRLTIKKKEKYLKVLLIPFISVLFSSCNPSDQIIEYGDPKIDITVYEDRIYQLSENGDTIVISYSISMSELTEYNDGLAHFQVHINNGDKIIENPLQILIHKVGNDSPLSDEILSSPNHPASILKRSGFRQDFSFIRSEEYIINVNSVSNHFQPISFTFQHPNGRI